MTSTSLQLIEEELSTELRHTPNSQHNSGDLCVQDYIPFRGENLTFDSYLYNSFSDDSNRDFNTFSNNYHNRSFDSYDAHHDGTKVQIAPTLEFSPFRDSYPTNDIETVTTNPYFNHNNDQYQSPKSSAWPLNMRFSRLNLSADDLPIDQSFLDMSSDSELSYTEISDDELVIQGSKFNHRPIPESAQYGRHLWENHHQQEYFPSERSLPRSPLNSVSGFSAFEYESAPNSNLNTNEHSSLMGPPERNDPPPLMNGFGRSSERGPPFSMNLSNGGQFQSVPPSHSGLHNPSSGMGYYPPEEMISSSIPHQLNHLPIPYLHPSHSQSILSSESMSHHHRPPYSPIGLNPRPDHQTPSDQIYPHPPNGFHTHHGAPFNNSHHPTASLDQSTEITTVQSHRGLINGGGVISHSQPMIGRNNPPSPRTPSSSLLTEHSQDPSPIPISTQSHPVSPPCRYFAHGYCSRGERCNFSHSPSPGTLISSTSSSVGVGVGGTQIHDEFDSAPEKLSLSAGGNITPRGSGRRPTRSVGAIPVPESPKKPFLPAIDVSRLQSLDQVVGQIYRICKDQHGCRFLQKKLEENGRNPQSVDIIFDEVYDYMVELMTDPFGNYLCQKLIEHCNEQQQLLIVQKVAPHLVKISKNMHGTRAVQKMIECLCTPSQVQLVVNALKFSVVQLIQDLNGNHVIQRCLIKLSSEDKQFVYDAVSAHCVEVASHRHGCCVMQRCIDYASQDQKFQLVREITNNVLLLVRDPFGNYVVQYILDLPVSLVKVELIRKFCGYLSILSTQKFSSNVIEKCLHVADEKVKVQLIDELMQENTLGGLLQDPYGNYVIQTALSLSDMQQRIRLVEEIKPLLPALRNTPYGKRIQNRIAKDCPGHEC